jgi:hypothetical protein
LRIELDESTYKILMAAAVHPALAVYFASCDIQSPQLDLCSLRKNLSERTLFDSAMSRERDEMDDDIYPTISSWQNSILNSERALGIFVLSLLESSVMENSDPLPTPEIVNNQFLVSNKEDLIACNRLIVGICSVFAVLGWSDSIGDERVLERVFGVLRIWQSVPEYSIVSLHQSICNEVLTTFQLKDCE